MKAPSHELGLPVRARGDGSLRARLRPPRSLRPTRAGWSFFALTLGVGFAALNTGNNLLYLVLSLMLAFLALSGFLSELALRHISVERRLPREVFAGTENRVELLIRNTGRRSSSYALVIEDRLAASAGGSRRERRRRRIAGRCFALRIAPLACERRSYPWTPATRGYAEFSDFTVSTRFPFALFVKSMEIPARARPLVYPAIRGVPHSDAAGRQGPTGEARTGSGNDGAEVSRLRGFVEGDSARRIHWRSSIRRGELLVGEIEPEHDAEIEVLLRTRLGAAGTQAASDPALQERFEERVSWAASEVVIHLEAGRRVALRSDSVHFAAATGAPHRAHLLSFLATVSPETAREADPHLGTRPGRR